ncbi:MAG TPA: alpha/beta hydrolase [Bacteroidia bacterium]|nr:alpha/beta hydrolase [Bacteroidia bacterium]
MNKHILAVEKTARYFTLGDVASAKNILFALHGYAQSAGEFLAQFEPVMQEGLVIVAPEGLHRFYARGGAGNVVASWMTKEERLDDIRDYVAFLDKVYRQIKQAAPDAEMTALGFSQGAATASRWIAAGNSIVKELILFCGFFPPDVPPGKISGDVKITVVTASNDKFISAEEEKKQLAEMKKIYPSLHHIRFDGEHTIDVATLEKILGK